MVFPGAVYISHPTEYGTLYTKKELENISQICKEYNDYGPVEPEHAAAGRKQYDKDKDRGTEHARQSLYRGHIRIKLRYPGRPASGGYLSYSRKIDLCPADAVDKAEAHYHIEDGNVVIEVVCVSCLGCSKKAGIYRGCDQSHSPYHYV